MLWILMALLAVAGGVLLIRRRRRYESSENEPWRASLEEPGEDLDLDEIRRAEDEWLAEEEWESKEDEEWH